MLEYNEEDGGVQFDPYDDELIQKVLIPKLRGEEEDCGDFIVMKNVYEKEPWLLDHTRGSFFKKNEWYYFVKRTQVSKTKNGCGKNSKRKITGDNDGGSWKLNAKEDILDVSGKTVGKKQTLKFNKSNNNKKKQKRGEGTSSATVPGSESSWIMTEYMLPEEKDKFQELILCKIHVINKSKKKDKNHEASTSYHHESIPASSSKQQPINIIHQTVQSPSLEQPISCGGGSGPEIPHIGSEDNDQVFETSGDPILEHQEINGDDFILAPLSSSFLGAAPFLKETDIDQETFLDPYMEQQPIRADIHESVLDSFSSEQQPINEAHRHDPEIPHIGSEDNDQVFETSRDPFLEPLEINDYYSIIAPLSSSFLGPAPLLTETYIDQETFLDTFLDLQPISADIHESVLDSFSSEQQPINEVHRHEPEIPHIGSENNYQVLETSRLSEDDTATVKEINGKEKCENLGPAKDKQLQIFAPLVCLGSEQEAEDEEEGDWLQDFMNSLMMPNGSCLPMEEDDEILNYDTSFIDQDLLDQYATLRPQESSQKRKLSTLGI